MSPGSAPVGGDAGTERRADPRRAALERLTRRGGQASQRRRAPDPFGLALVRFNRHCPGLLHRPGLWPTRDGVIPWRTFWLLYDTVLPAEGAFDQLQQFGAAALAIALTMGDGQGKVAAQAAVDRLHALAFPE